MSAADFTESKTLYWLASGEHQVGEHDHAQLDSSPDTMPEGSTDDAAFDLHWLSAADIRDELLCARYLKQAEIDRFVSLGVKASALYVSGPVFVDQVVFQDDGLFEFGRYVAETKVQNAFILEVRGSDRLIDLAAWDPSGNRCALWLGRGFALGEDQIWFPALSGGRLQIWRSPLGWLRAYRDGLVILNPPAAHSYLCDVPVLVAEDANHRKQIEKMLVLRKPRVVVAPSVFNSLA